MLRAQPLQHPHVDADQVGMKNADHLVRRARRIGDRPQDVGDYAGINTILDYKCATGLSAEEIDNAARILRSDAVFIELLRLRIGDIKSQLSNAQLFLSEDVRNNILSMSKENS